MSDEARELELFIENDGDLYRQQMVPIQKNLINKMAQGKYDHEKAVKLWMYLMESGAKKYVREFGGGDWHRVFPIDARREAARSFARHFEVEAKNGEHNHLLTKASIAKMKKPSNANRSGGTVNDRLFIGVMAGGISYADRSREEHGDYKRLAFLPYDTLKLEMRPRVPADLKAAIVKHAASVQAKIGQQYPVSSSGQTVLLGRNRSGKTKPAPKWPIDRDRYHGNPNARRNRSGTGLRLVHLINGWTFVFGDSPTRMGDSSMFFESRGQAVNAASRQGLTVAKNGNVNVKKK